MLAPDRASIVKFSTGTSRRELIDRSLAEFAIADRARVTVACGPLRRDQRESVVRDLVEALRFAGSQGTVLIAPGSPAGAALQARSTVWVDVDVSARASRLTRVKIPAALAGEHRVVLVTALPERADRKAPVSIGVWARYAHPRQRLGAAWSDHRDGLTAEIALAVQPELILLFGVWKGLDVVVETNDQIAAELTAIAWQQQTAPDDSEPIGPWEHPLVQRATELNLGALTPSKIHAELRWHGDEDAPAKHAFEQFSADLFARIGIAASG